VQQLHHDVQRAVGRLAQLVRGDRVRIAQPGQRRALAAEPRDHPRIRRQLRVQHLQRELMPGPDMRRPVDRPEPSRSQARLDAEAAVKDFAHQGVAALDHGAFVVVWIHGPARKRLCQGLLPPTSHDCAYCLSQSITAR
jgi:hypothetical protein